MKEDGEACQAIAITNSPYCFFHDPQKKVEREQASALGGSKNRAAVLPSHSEYLPTANAEDILKLIGTAIHHVRTGQLDPRIANCIGYLSGIALKAIEQGKTEERIEALEAAIKNNIGNVEKDFSRHDDQVFSFENRE